MSGAKPGNNFTVAALPGMMNMLVYKVNKSKNVKIKLNWSTKEHLTGWECVGMHHAKVTRNGNMLQCGCIDEDVALAPMHHKCCAMVSAVIVVQWA